MTIEEMHIMFRELAQQMGQHTVRAIFPEDIDNCINNAIIKKVKDILISNVGIEFADKNAKQNTNISPINSLRNLIRDITISNKITGEGTELNPFKVSIKNNEVMIYTQFCVSYDNEKLYDCRLIDNDRLVQTLHDYINRATKTSPIVAIFDNSTDTILQVYTGKNKTKPTTVRYYYIKLPNKVYYDESSKENWINCDLPEYLHSEIVQDAINYYLASMGIDSK